MMKKKFFLTMAAVLLSAVGLQAQQLQVQSFKLDPTDVTASTQRRADDSGTPCALVKLQTTAKIAKVEGNVVGDIVDRGPEQWVYVAKGTDQLTITPEGGSPINVSFANYQVSSAKSMLTYVLVIGSQASAGETKYHEAEALMNEEKMEQAFQTLMQSVELGYLPAYNAVGASYLFGWGVKEDMEKAIEYFKKGAELGEPGAQYSLADRYVRGEGVPQDFGLAAMWAEKAAKQGHPDAQFAMANLCLEGRGVAQNTQQALNWLEKAAEQGHGYSLVHLGNMYMLGVGVTADRDKAISYLEKAAEQDIVQAYALLASAYSFKGDEAKVTEYMKRGAVLGEPNCMASVGIYYMAGVSGFEKDYYKAFEYLKKAEDAGVKSAPLYTSLAQCYENGWGVNKDKKLARKYQEMATEAAKAMQENARNIRKKL